MTSFLIYIFKWAVALTLLYSLYGLLLRRETFHFINRIVLLLILLVSMVLPFVQVETHEPNYVTQGREILESRILFEERVIRKEGDYWWGDAKDEYASNMSRITQRPLEEDESLLFGPKEWNWAHTLLLMIEIYCLGMVIAWLRYIWSLAMLIRLILQGKRVEIKGLPKQVRVITHPSVKTPCSWMKWIILGPDDTEPSTHLIIQHELSHIRLGHSWDMLLCELTCRMLWFVPFAWMLRQDLRDVHEYQADRSVLATGVKDEEYQLLLIRKATCASLLPVVNALNQAQIKKRLSMMYARPSTKTAMFKVLYLLPLIGFTLSVFATPPIEARVEQEVGEALQPLSTEEPQGTGTMPDEEQTDTVSNPVFTGTVEFDEEPLYTGTLVAGEDTLHLQNARYEAVKPQPSALTGRWGQIYRNSEGQLVISQQKVYLPDGTFRTICIHNDGEEHTISAGTWQPIDEHHYVEHIGYITTDPSSEGKNNVITYSLTGNDQQLYLSYVMPGNGVSGSEFWQRIE